MNRIEIKEDVPSNLNKLPGDVVNILSESIGKWAEVDRKEKDEKRRGRR